MPDGLVLYEAARAAIAAARSVDEARDWRDKAEALRAYARIAGDRQGEIDMAEIRIRAERRVGALMALQRGTVGLQHGGRPKTGLRSDPVSPALADVGINKYLADRARRYAELAEDEFERLLAGRRKTFEGDRATRVTVHLVPDDKAAQRAEREVALAAKVKALPDKRYGVILDDNEWRFEVFSRETGLDRSPDNHYPTSELAAIEARSREVAENLAAPDCAWFRWVTVPYLAHGLRVTEIAGFVYKTHWIWAKDRVGTGYWNRNRHEVLLLAVRGNVPCPAPGTQWDSLIPAPVAEHSAKPESFIEMIEDAFPNVPKIEMNRRGPARLGWDAWGNEAETGEVAA